MDREKRDEIKILFEDFLDEGLIRIILSNPVLKEGAGPGKVLKVRVRPVMLKGGMVFQAEELTEKQAFHRNLTKEEGCLTCSDCLRAVLSRRRRNLSKDRPV